ncbi:MAG TPA: amidohydrolase [Chloroflexota bacterium]|nr:amidohydrolase [Chloroflexota bacterium]
METLTLDLKDVAEQVVLDRRHLHMHPELRFEEHETGTFVAERLRALGLEVRHPVGQTGVVGLLRGGRPRGPGGRTLMLRADMDALPIQEENDVPYRSTVPGAMHACGHDGHTAILLGVAQVLARRPERLAGDLKLCFQPAEEGSGGALAMIEAGVLEEPKVDAAVGLHLAQWLPLGTVAVSPGAIHATPTRLEIDISGRGGHAAAPHRCVDAVLVAAQVVVALHQIVAREVNPLELAVITIGSSHAGTTFNVIADTAQLRGTIRAYDEEMRDFLRRRIEEVATGVARAMRAEAAVRTFPGPPPVVNDPDLADLVASVAAETPGVRETVACQPSMGADDVAEYLKRVPGCYFWLGTRNEQRGLVWDHHHPRFDLDEAALPLGVELLGRIAERYLSG